MSEPVTLETITAGDTITVSAHRPRLTRNGKGTDVTGTVRRALVPCALPADLDDNEVETAPRIETYVIALTDGTTVEALRDAEVTLHPAPAEATETDQP